METRPIAFLSDFGAIDPYVGICRGVMLDVNPGLATIDVTHGISRQDVLAGAVALAEAAPFMPDRCVFLAVVDPGVGSDRRAVAIETEDGCMLVGPDNGLLLPAAETRGGALHAVEISNSAFRLTPTSQTFHGRDIFAPVAAQLACGAELSEAGSTVDPASLVQLKLPTASVIEGELITAVTSVDSYGNARLATGGEDFGELEVGQAVEIDTGDLRRQAVFADSFSYDSDGAPLVIVDSTGSFSIALCGANAADSLRLTPGKRVTLSRAG